MGSCPDTDIDPDLSSSSQANVTCQQNFQAHENAQEEN